MPVSAIVYQLVDGPAFPRPGRVPFRSSCVQVDFYGPDLRSASALFEQWYSDFYPVDLSKPTGFIAASTAVSSIELLGAPFAHYDLETAWPRVTITLMVKHLDTTVGPQTYTVTVGTTQEQQAG